jgi:hypothetical protein
LITSATEHGIVAFDLLINIENRPVLIYGLGINWIIVSIVINNRADIKSMANIKF